jgi:hypothetical protein
LNGGDGCEQVNFLSVDAFEDPSDHVEAQGKDALQSVEDEVTEFEGELVHDTLVDNVRSMDPAPSRSLEVGPGARVGWLRVRVRLSGSHPAPALSNVKHLV